MFDLRQDIVYSKNLNFNWSRSVCRFSIPRTKPEEVVWYTISARLQIWTRRTALTAKPAKTYTSETLDSPTTVMSGLRTKIQTEIQGIDCRTGIAASSGYENNFDGLGRRI